VVEVRRRTVFRMTCFLVLLSVLAASSAANMPNTLCACQELRVGRLEERIGDFSLAQRSMSLHELFAIPIDLESEQHFPWPEIGKLPLGLAIIMIDS